jgi:hypothetical protein
MERSEINRQNHSIREDGTVQVELWTYRPEMLAKNGIVDQLSLYLSLREDPDERVSDALETMLEKFPW